MRDAVPPPPAAAGRAGRPLPRPPRSPGCGILLGDHTSARISRPRPSSPAEKHVRRPPSASLRAQRTAPAKRETERGAEPHILGVGGRDPVQNSSRRRRGDPSGRSRVSELSSPRPASHPPARRDLSSRSGRSERGSDVPSRRPRVARQRDEARRDATPPFQLRVRGWVLRTKRPRAKPTSIPPRRTLPTAAIIPDREHVRRPPSRFPAGAAHCPREAGNGAWGGAPHPWGGRAGSL